MDPAIPNKISTAPVMPVPPAQNSMNLATSPSKKSSNNTFFIIASISVIIVIIITTIFLYVLNGKTPTTKQKGTTKPTPYVPKTPQEKKMAANLQKYGVVCRRFTQLDEALKTPDIACILDLSGKGISSLPNDITKLTYLNEINLSKNNFTEFPSQLLKIPTLTIIDLSRNKLTLTPDVTRSTTLRSLILSGNPIINRITPIIEQVPLEQATSPAIRLEKPHGPLTPQITY